MADKKSEFIRRLKKNQKLLKEKAGTTHSAAFLSDEEICDLLGLEESSKSVFHCKLTRCNAGFDKNNDMFMTFGFAIGEGEHKGVAFSEFISLADSDKERYERGVTSIIRNFQRLGIDTTEWSAAEVVDNIYDTVERLTAEKPGVKMALSRYVGTNGDRLNMSILGLADDPEGSDSSSKTSKKAESESEESESEEPESGDAEESESGDSEDGPWIGYEASVDLGEGEVTVTTKSYDEDSGVYTVEDENGDEYEVYTEDLNWV